MKYKNSSRNLLIVSIIFMLSLACNLPSLNRNISEDALKPDQTTLNIPEPILEDESENDKSSTAISFEMGLSRKQPYPVGNLVNIDGWQIEVREFLRGSAAMNVINASGRDVQSLAEGSEYALARVFLRCVALDDEAHSLGISDISITGSSNKIYGDQLDGLPQPEFLFEDMFTAEAVEGWVDAIVPVSEKNLMLVVDLNNWDPAERKTRYFSLEEGASITFPVSGTEKAMNSVGIDISNPALLNQEMILKNWALIVEEVISGEQALNLLQQSNPKFPPPEPGWQYLLIKVKVEYFQFADIPATLQSSHFYAVDQLGDLNAGANRFINTPKSAEWVWLNERLLPGAAVEGWVIVATEVDSHPLIIAFDPDEFSWDNSGESKRYIKLAD